MQLRIKDSFSILLLVADVIQIFGERLKLPRIAVVPEAYLCPRLILNLPAQRDSDNLSVNQTTNREVAQELLQFDQAFSRILQAVWEADLVQGLVRVSKVDVTDAYHRSTVKPAQVGEFSYVIPSSPGDEGKLSASTWSCQWGK